MFSWQSVRFLYRAAAVYISSARDRISRSLPDVIISLKSVNSRHGTESLVSCTYEFLQIGLGGYIPNHKGFNTGPFRCPPPQLDFGSPKLYIRIVLHLCYLCYKVSEFVLLPISDDKLISFGRVDEMLAP